MSHYLVFMQHLTDFVWVQGWSGRGKQFELFQVEKHFPLSTEYHLACKCSKLHPVQWRIIS